MIIDFHQHFWQHSQPFDYSWQDAELLAPIRRDFLPSEFEAIFGETVARFYDLK